jgi:hypothetical protein
MFILIKKNKEITRVLNANEIYSSGIIVIILVIMSFVDEIELFYYLLFLLSFIHSRFKGHPNEPRRWTICVYF